MLIFVYLDQSPRCEAKMKTDSTEVYFMSCTKPKTWGWKGFYLSHTKPEIEADWGDFQISGFLIQVGDWVRSFVQSPRGGYLSCGSHSRKSVPDYEGSFVQSPRGGYLSCGSHSKKSVPNYEGSFVQSPRGGCLISRVFGSKFKRIEYRKFGHYVPKGFLTMNLEKVTKTCPMLLEAWGSLYIKA